jgi:hypothetical protein
MNQVPVMKGWKSYFLWEGLPFLMLFSMFGFISAINWDYEKKLFTPDNSGPAGSSSVHLGLILLAFAMGYALFASVLLFIVRIIIRITYPTLSSGWYMFVPLVLISVFFIFPSLFVIILGPATITIMDQMSEAPR